MSAHNLMTLFKRTSLNVYDADIFNCSRQSLRSHLRCPSHRIVATRSKDLADNRIEQADEPAHTRQDRARRALTAWRGITEKALAGVRGEENEIERIRRELNPTRPVLRRPNARLSHRKRENPENRRLAGAEGVEFELAGDILNSQ
jgi:hypothetical protein